MRRRSRAWQTREPNGQTLAIKLHAAKGIIMTQCEVPDFPIGSLPVVNAKVHGLPINLLLTISRTQACVTFDKEAVNVGRIDALPGAFKGLKVFDGNLCDRSSGTEAGPKQRYCDYGGSRSHSTRLYAGAVLANSSVRLVPLLQGGGAVPYYAKCHATLARAQRGGNTMGLCILRKLQLPYLPTPRR